MPSSHATGHAPTGTAGHSPTGTALSVVPDAQGATLTFNGRSYSHITNISVVFANAGTYDYVPMNASVISSGTAAHVPRARVMPGTVQPGTLTVQGLGSWDGPNAGGEYGTLVLTGAGGATLLSTHAFLVRVNRDLAVNDVVRSSLEFQVSEFA